MTTRSRTLLFLQYRNSYSRIHKVVLDTSEKAGLISNNDERRSIDAAELPPVWVDTVDDVDESIGIIREKMQELEQLHRKHLLPGFDDRTKEEQVIDRLTSDITSRFQACQKQIKQIQDKQRNIHTNEQRKLSQNVQTRLATKLQELSAEFRKEQSNYLQKMKGRDAMANDMYDVELGEPDDDDLGFNDTQMEVIQSNEREISKREREINQIAQSINSLAEIFKDIQTMVIDQGTVLDRIDYNVEMTVANLQEANQQLVKGAEYQKSTTNRLCIMILIFLIILMLLILIFKPRR